MNGVEGIIDIEHDLPGHMAEGGAVLIDQRFNPAQERPEVGLVFQTGDRWPRGEITPGGQPVLCQLERRIGAQARGVIAVLVTGGDHQQPKPDDAGKAVHDLILRAWTIDATCQTFGHAKPLLDLPQNR